MSSSHLPSQPALNRRQFLGSSARNAAQAAVGAVGLSQMQPLQAHARVAASDAVRVGVIGLRNQGLSLLRAFAAVPGCTIGALCDIDETVCQQAASILPGSASGVRQEQDFRRLLDDRSLHAVVIATPDHHHAWMTALAVAAGKAVYLEVPTTHTLTEADQLRAMLRQGAGLVQTGLAHRSGAHYQSAMQYLHAGSLGQIRYARAWACQQRQKLRPLTAPADPPNAEFSAAWLGQNQSTQLHPADWHFHWRWMWQFGSGELGTWGVTLLDIARWGLQVGLPNRVSATGGTYHFQDARETPDTLAVQFDYGETSILWEHRQWTSRGIEGRPQGVAFYADRGVLIIDRSGWKVYDHTPAPGQSASDPLLPHVTNFVDAIRERASLAADFETGCTSSQLCHLGNLAYRQQSEWRSDAGPASTRQA